MLAIVTAVAAGSWQTSWAAPKAATGTVKKPAKKPAKSTTGTTTAEAAGTALVEFCDEVMHKLQQREHDNLSHIKWDSDADGVHGTFTGYSQEHTCKMVEGTEKDPVAKIQYRELRYKKHGSTITEAEQSTPEAVEIFEVQEIFHFLKGKWDY